MTTYNLKSVQMVNVPGMVRYIQHVYEDDQEKAFELLEAMFPTLSRRVHNMLISGAFTVDGENIILEVTD